MAFGRKKLFKANDEHSPDLLESAQISHARKHVGEHIPDAEDAHLGDLPRADFKDPVKMKKRGRKKKGQAMHIPDAEAEGDDFDINLVPEKEGGISPKQKQILLIKFVVLFVFLAVLVLSLFFYMNREIREGEAAVQSVTFQIDSVNKDIVELEESQSDAIRVQAHLAATEVLLDQHRYIDAFFKKMETLTHENVYYTALILDQNKATVTARAKDYATFAEQMRVLEADEDILDVSVSTIRVVDEFDEDRPRKVASGDILITFDSSLFTDFLTER